MNRLKTFQCLLQHTSERMQDTSLAEERVKQLRETAFYIEDVLDEFLLEMELLESNKPINFCEVKNIMAVMVHFFKKAWLRLKFRKDLKDIKRKLEFQEGEQQKYESLTVINGASSIVRDSRYKPMENVNMVGMDEELSKLQDLVEQPRDHMLVITVWGPGGSGKTTLVRKVYEQVKDKMDCYAWIYANQPAVDVLRSMLEELSSSKGNSVPQDLGRMNENELQKSISEALRHKRYLLILDDIWDSNFLQPIKLPIENMSSIIVTSRQEDATVMYFLEAVRHVLEVKPLYPSSSWQLFCKMAFPLNPLDPPKHLIELGKELVLKCNGLPLAILAIAQLMATKNNDLGKWNKSLRDLNSDLHGDLAVLNQALLLSYYHLPVYLKHCFLYCAMFPKSVHIRIRKLIRLWIAEGFIKKDDHKTPEHIGRSYLDELVNRSMLQLSNGSIGLQMHDLLREVAVSMIEKENFGKILKQNTGLHSNPRRLAIHVEAPKAQLDTCKLRLRSLLAGCGDSFYSSLFQMLQNIKLIRTLDLEGVTRIDSVPDELGDLIYLRYLGLKKTALEKLPDSVRKLRYLQTLDVQHCSLQCLPEGIAELTQLRHLLASQQGRYVKMPNITFSFTQLQSLGGVHLKLNQASQLKSTTQLTKLNISATGEESWREIFIAIGMMDNLQKLKLIAGRSETKILMAGNLSASPYLENLLLKGIGGPRYFIVSHNNLHYIMLAKCNLLEDSFTALGRLPMLEILFMEDYQAERLVVEPESFQKLKRFVIMECKNLTTWNQIPKGSMEGLIHLQIGNCPRLQMLPEGLQELKNLKYVVLFRKATKLIKRMFDDKKKIIKMIENGKWFEGQAHQKYPRSYHFKVQH